jgi:hypothetical protein
MRRCFRTNYWIVVVLLLSSGTKCLAQTPSPPTGVRIGQEKADPAPNPAKILVQNPPFQNQPSVLTLQLNAAPTTLKTGESVQFVITPEVQANKFEFTVDFKDGPPQTIARGRTEISHVFKKPGSYAVSVMPEQINSAAFIGPVISNNAVTILVESIPLIVEPRSANVEEPFAFTIDFGSQDSTITYRLIFDDGEPAMQSAEPTFSRRFKSAGVYKVSGEVLGEGWEEAIPTESVEVRVIEPQVPPPQGGAAEPEPSRIPSPTPTSRRWPYILAGLAVVVTGVKTRQWYLAGKPLLTLHRGSVHAEQGKGAPLKIILEIVFVPGVGSGDHHIDGLVVKRIKGEKQYGRRITNATRNVRT